MAYPNEYPQTTLFDEILTQQRQTKITLISSSLYPFASLFIAHSESFSKCNSLTPSNKRDPSVHSFWIPPFFQRSSYFKHSFFLALLFLFISNFVCNQSSLLHSCIARMGQCNSTSEERVQRIIQTAQPRMIIAYSTIQNQYCQNNFQPYSASAKDLPIDKKYLVGGSLLFAS